MIFFFRRSSSMQIPGTIRIGGSWTWVAEGRITWLAELITCYKPVLTTPRHLDLELRRHQHEHDPNTIPRHHTILYYTTSYLYGLQDEPSSAPLGWTSSFKLQERGTRKTRPRTKDLPGKEWACLTLQATLHSSDLTFVGCTVAASDRKT